MDEEEVAGDVADSEHRERVSVVGWDVSEVPGDVDGDKGGAREEGDRGEEPAHHAQETEEHGGVEPNLIYEFWFFDVEDGGYPAKDGVGYPRWGLVAFMVLDFGFVNDLWVGQRGQQPATETICKRTR